jgi:hypothetical protein
MFWRNKHTKNKHYTIYKNKQQSINLSIHIIT